MEKKVILIFFVILLFFSGTSCFGVPLESAIYKLNNGNSDSIPNQKYFRIIKINPLQILLCEIPVSFESFYKVNRSIQFQLGFIFPFNDHPAEKLFESMGTNGTASDEGLFSYRNSPLNNYGLSFKTEFRTYGRYLYYAPQLMYKFCFYKNTTFPVYNGSITIDQTESKFSNIFGLGFIIGRQTYKRNLVFDWYAGAGLRLRSMSVTIVKIVDPPRPDRYPDTRDNDISFYPFVNLGFRIGIKL